jgi:L-alanine-DL-glutamate epimerase-like enolase superfamily enzyme
MEAAWNPGTVTTHSIGGGSIIEIHTDQGFMGIGPAVDSSALEPAKAQLVGKDPFAIEQLAGPLRYYLGQSPRTVSSVEIALWDLIGKAAGQPLYKLWGAAKDRVRAYASMIQLSTADERVRMAVQLKAQGWKSSSALITQYVRELPERMSFGEGLGIARPAPCGKFR